MAACGVGLEPPPLPDTFWLCPLAGVSFPMPLRTISPESSEDWQGRLKESDTCRPSDANRNPWKFLQEPNRLFDQVVAWM